MAKLLKLRRGTTNQHGTFTGAEGECTVDMDKDVLVIHDGTTQGGHPVAAEDMSNVSSASIVGRINNSHLAGVKVQPNFGSQNVETTGTLASGNHTVTGNISVSGTVDGRDLATDGSKLDGIQAGAKDDQTAAEIRVLVEAANDSNVFTDADHSKLNNIQAGATDDQTAAEIRVLVEAASDSNVFTDADHSKLNGIASSANNYSHPSHPGDDFSVDTGALSGAVVVSDIDINVSTDSLGHVTDANGSVSTRTLTLANLGYTGATNANYITNNNDITNGRGFTTYTSNQATDTTSNVNFASVTASGNVTAFSDATLKTDIHTINDALGIVGKLRGVTYKWLSNGEADIGVIAQEVQEVVPEVVKETVDGLKTVDYGRLVSVLINAVNELNEKLDKHIEGGK
jgi:hypothetical protein